MPVVVGEGVATVTEGPQAAKTISAITAMANSLVPVRPDEEPARRDRVAAREGPGIGSRRLNIRGIVAWPFATEHRLEVPGVTVSLS